MVRLSPLLPLLTAANRERARLVFVLWQFVQAMGASALLIGRSLENFVPQSAQQYS